MNIREYEKVKDLTYREYCDYLQNKYGIGLSDYMTKSYYRNKKVTRTNEGLIAHHKYEDVAIWLSKKKYAERCPFEWQKAENIVYCDYLEHLLLHILICQYPSKDKKKNEDVGNGGILVFLVPELNDVYSGWQPAEQWRKNCYDLIINDKDVYLTLLRRYIELKEIKEDEIDILLTSRGIWYDEWDIADNENLFKEIENLIL